MLAAVIEPAATCGAGNIGIQRDRGQAPDAAAADTAIAVLLGLYECRDEIAEDTACPDGPS